MFYEFFRDDAENLLLRGVYKEVIAGHHAEPEGARCLLSPRSDQFLSRVRIVQPAEGRDCAVERGLLHVTVGLADFEVCPQ